MLVVELQHVSTTDQHFTKLPLILKTHDINDQWQIQPQVSGYSCQTGPSDETLILLKFKTGFTEDASVILCQTGPEHSEEGLNLITRTRTDQI